MTFYSCDDYKHSFLQVVKVKQRSLISSRPELGGGNYCSLKLQAKDK